MIKKVQQDLRAFFFTQDKYISHDKHLKPTPPPPQKLRWWYYYSHVVVSALSSTMNTCQRKNNHTIICQIYLLVLSTQCQRIQSALSYLTVIFLLWKPNILALLSVRKSHNRIPQSMIWNFSGGERASMFRFLPFVIVGQLNWRDPLGHHPTLWYILQYELWIDFIFTTTQESEMLNGNVIFGLLDETTLAQNEKWRPPVLNQAQPWIPNLKPDWLSSLIFCPTVFVLSISKIGFIHIFLSATPSSSLNWQLKSVNTWKMVISLYIGFVKHWSKVYDLF